MGVDPDAVPPVTETDVMKRSQEAVLERFYEKTGVDISADVFKAEGWTAPNLLFEIAQASPPFVKNGNYVYTTFTDILNYEKKYFDIRCTGDDNLDDQAD